MIFLIMAISVAVNVENLASAALDKLQGAMTPKALAANIGEAEVILFQNHFRNAPPNKYGYPSTGFWPAAARATNYTVLGDAGLTINVNKQGVRQRLEGGTILPTGGRKHLAIPARAEAYGKLPGEFNNLSLAFHRIGGRAEAFALVEAAATQLVYGRKKRDGSRDRHTVAVGGGVFFWLVKSVNQLPDPGVIPADRDIVDVAKQTMTDIIIRQGGAK